MQRLQQRHRFSRRSPRWVEGSLASQLSGERLRPEEASLSGERASNWGPGTSRCDSCRHVPPPCTCIHSYVPCTHAYTHTNTGNYHGNALIAKGPSSPARAPARARRTGLLSRPSHPRPRATHVPPPCMRTYIRAMHACIHTYKRVRVCLHAYACNSQAECVHARTRGRCRG